ncbi:stress enhanced protein 2, chloroplastic [Nymphaea colorata]|nr:stress enhanced protein 2, chloroplastic [Nymphaea colorata]
MAAASVASQSFFCELQQKPASPKKDLAVTRVRIPDASSPENSKIMLQPRLCNLRTYGAPSSGLLKAREDSRVSPFFDSLSAYIDNSRKTEFVEILSGRLAMIAFAAAVGVEMVTGNSLFGKVGMQGIVEGGGLCLGAVACAATFAFLSTARTRVGNIFTLSCNSLVDSLIDNLVDGLFYEDDFQDWLDDI